MLISINRCENLRGMNIDEILGKTGSLKPIFKVTYSCDTAKSKVLKAELLIDVYVQPCLFVCGSSKISCTALSPIALSKNSSTIQQRFKEASGPPLHPSLRETPLHTSFKDGEIVRNQTR